MKNVLQLEMCHSPPTTALFTPSPNDQSKKINKSTVSMYKKLFFFSFTFFKIRYNFKK